ncbi:hypothetical protein FHG87_008119 [Trinorchestia longiramus]|nr:hypothetical protein FHG87_008119 [Trinorchestia longiramus]
METENIWEVDSNCSVDEELSKELEELEKQEELQNEQPNIGFKNGSLISSSNQTQAANGESFGGGKEFGGLVFKNTGVINVAHSHHLSDAYKRKKQRKLLGLSVTGVAADIARREKKRLQYHKMKSDPLFVAKRNEYRKKYRMRRKLLLKMRTAQKKAEDGLASTFFDDGSTEGSNVAYGNNRLLYSQLTSKGSSSFNQVRNWNGQPSSQSEGLYGVEGSHLNENVTSASCVFSSDGDPRPYKAFKMEPLSASTPDTASERAGNKTPSFSFAAGETCQVGWAIFLSGVLHKRFLATHLRDCSLKMFIDCLPRTMERKGAFARGFTSCLSCGNAEILYENLVEQQIIDLNCDFERVLLDRKLRARLMASLNRVTDLNRNLSCFSWLKSLKGNFARSLKSVTETVGSLVVSFKEELTRLDEHLDGVYVKYCVMRAALARCEGNSDEAMVHITWCENPKVYSRSASNHMTVEQNISLLSGYVWTAQKEYSFVSLSDQRDHSTSVLWSHLEDALHDIVLMGYSKLFIISDPPMNHFRNKANFYYMNEFAVKRNVQIRWLFSASYHTYLTADFTGLKVKEMIEKNTQSNVKTFGSNPYQTSSELISMLRPLTDATFYLARKEDIEANISSLPELQTIKGTQTFAEVLIAPSKFYVKLDSADEYWTKVLVVF